jgi:hypothetical protein
MALILEIACTTDPLQNSPIGTWQMVDLNNQPLPIPHFIVEHHLVITADGQWSDYFDNSATADHHGTWTYINGRLSLDAPIHGDGRLIDGKLQVEWGYLTVYHYRRARD